MSVYSGFATRQQETFYNKVLEKSISMMATRLIAYLKGIQTDELRWARQLRKLIKYSYAMDKNKFLPPKFSESFLPLAQVLKEHYVTHI